MDPILANHLEFFRRHRAEVRRGTDGVSIVGNGPGLSSWIPLSAQADAPANAEAIRLVPASGEGWERRLEAMGYRAAEELSYQRLAIAGSDRAPASTVDIRRGSSADDALSFADVQASAFLEPDDQGAETLWWRAAFPRVALANIADAAQAFLIARAGGQDAAVLLMLDAAQTTGIYAVATRPEYRGQGLSGALLDRAHALAVERGGRELVLQAMRGSYAEGFYLRRGFTEDYRSNVWRRLISEA